LFGIVKVLLECGVSMLKLCIPIIYLLLLGVKPNLFQKSDFAYM